MIAKVAAIELPRNQWPELIDELLKNMMQSEPSIKQATLETLGYVCEELVELHLNIVRATSLISFSALEP